MTAKLGIKVHPGDLEMLFRTGASITTKDGMRVTLKENGVPENHRMVDCGFNRREGHFFFVFAPPNCGRQINWQAPVYEKE